MARGLVTKRIFSLVDRQFLNKITSDDLQVSKVRAHIFTHTSDGYHPKIQKPKNFTPSLGVKI
jgi:hypothetical protein